MGQYAVKVTDQGRDYYIHWSEIVDAPMFVAVSLADYQSYFLDRFGRDNFDYWTRVGRWDQLETVGLSTAFYDTPREAMACNRAGPNETQLTYEDIIERYCQGRTESGKV
jgi:hypothetical protein